MCPSKFLFPLEFGVTGRRTLTQIIIYKLIQRAARLKPKAADGMGLTSRYGGLQFELIYLII